MMPEAWLKMPNSCARVIPMERSLLISSVAKEQGGELKVDLCRVEVETSRAPQFIDITDIVRTFVDQVHPRLGFVLVFSKHTTAAIKINENEPLLLQDMERFLDKLSPRNDYYGHNNFDIRTVNMEEGEDPNGHAHCQHLLLGASETIPVVAGEIQLGRWQRVFLVELDRPRQREVLIQVLGY